MLLKTAVIALAAAAQPADEPLVLTPLDLLPRPMIVEIERDPITDSVSAFAVAEARDGRLAVGCDPDRYRGIRVSFRSRHWLAGENYITASRRITYRFDRAAPVRGRWDIDHDKATLRARPYVPAFVGSIAGARQLTIRTRDIENRERDLVFSLEGGRPALDRMLEVCRLSGLSGIPAGR